MGIFTNYIVSIGNNRTVYKLIVVRVLLYEMKIILRVILQAIGTIHNKINHVFCYKFISLYSDYFLIFLDNFI